MPQEYPLGSGTVSPVSPTAIPIVTNNTYTSTTSGAPVSKDGTTGIFPDCSTALTAGKAKKEINQPRPTEKLLISPAGAYHDPWYTVNNEWNNLRVDFDKLPTAKKDMERLERQVVQYAKDYPLWYLFLMASLERCKTNEAALKYSSVNAFFNPNHIMVEFAGKQLIERPMTLPIMHEGKLKWATWKFVGKCFSPNPKDPGFVHTPFKSTCNDVDPTEEKTPFYAPSGAIK